MRSPEELAREKIDALLEQCGWILQNRSTIVQHLQSAQLDGVSRVCISTIQRLYSMLRFVFGLKGCRRANSREETGSALLTLRKVVFRWSI